MVFEQEKCLHKDEEKMQNIDEDEDLTLALFRRHRLEVGSNMETVQNHATTGKSCNRITIHVNGHII